MVLSGPISTRQVPIVRLVPFPGALRSPAMIAESVGAVPLASPQLTTHAARRPAVPPNAPRPPAASKPPAALACAWMLLLEGAAVGAEAVHDAATVPDAADQASLLGAGRRDGLLHGGDVRTGVLRRDRVAHGAGGTDGEDGRGGEAKEGDARAAADVHHGDAPFAGRWRGPSGGITLLNCSVVVGRDHSRAIPGGCPRLEHAVPHGPLGFHRRVDEAALGAEEHGGAAG